VTVTEVVVVVVEAKGKGNADFCEEVTLSNFGMKAGAAGDDEAEIVPNPAKPEGGTGIAGGGFDGALFEDVMTGFAAVSFVCAAFFSSNSF
jgi:hypothetical protein